MKGIQDTSTNNFGDLVSNNKKYIIPRFQRDYSWTEEQWEDLWEDIEAAINEANEHYMGYLVLQTSNNKEFLIIDGQQRFTTITLIILAAIKSISKLSNKEEFEENNKRIETLKEKYIGHIDPVSLEYDNNLILNKNNNAFYKDYIVKLGSLKVRGLSCTEKLMKKCFEWFENKLLNKFKTGKEYAEFIIRMVDSLFFTVITVNDEMNAFRVFETLNARGVQLSSADLLKNYFFSLVDLNTSHGSHIKILEEKWNKLTANVKTDKLADFLRYYWNSQNKTVRSSELFKEIRSSIKDDKHVFLLVSDLIEYSDIYMALKDPEDEFWEEDDEIKKYIYLLQIFNLKQPFSILMSAYKNLTIENFKKVLKTVVIICFRYSVISSKNANEIERSFNDCAISINKNKSFNISSLLKIYISDDEFVNIFTKKTFPVTSRNTKIVRYILSEINYYKDQIAIDCKDEKNSIEHILPQNPNDNWDIDEDKIEIFSIRLGNLCLLEKNLNNNISNEIYEIKKEVLLKSAFATTKSIPQHYSEWNEKSIESRQKQMANIAKSIWKVNF